MSKNSFVVLLSSVAIWLVLIGVPSHARPPYQQGQQSGQRAEQANRGPRNNPAPMFNQEQRVSQPPSFRPPQDSVGGPRRLSAEERHQLREQIIESNRDLRSNASGRRQR